MQQHSTTTIAGNTCALPAVHGHDVHQRDGNGDPAIDTVTTISKMPSDGSRHGLQLWGTSAAPSDASITPSPPKTASFLNNEAFPRILERGGTSRRVSTPLVKSQILSGHCPGGPERDGRLIMPR